VAGASLSQRHHITRALALPSPLTRMRPVQESRPGWNFQVLSQPSLLLFQDLPPSHHCPRLACCQGKWVVDKKGNRSIVTAKTVIETLEAPP
jgi:hypothetical protein